MQIPNSVVKVACNQIKPLSGVACFSIDGICLRIGSRNIWWQRWDKVNGKTGVKPQSHIHDFGHGRATIHPNLSDRDASA